MGVVQYPRVSILHMRIDWPAYAALFNICFRARSAPPFDEVKHFPCILLLEWLAWLELVRTQEKFPHIFLLGQSARLVLVRNQEKFLYISLLRWLASWLGLVRAHGGCLCPRSGTKAPTSSLRLGGFGSSFSLYNATRIER